MALEHYHFLKVVVGNLQPAVSGKTLGSMKMTGDEQLRCLRGSILPSTESHEPSTADASIYFIKHSNSYQLKTTAACKGTIKPFNPLNKLRS